MFDDIDPFTATAGELLAQVIDLEPGPLAMSVLLMIDRSRLSSCDAVTFLQVHERLTSWWASVQADAIVAAANPEPLVEEYTILEPHVDRAHERTLRIHDAIREEISSALRWAPATAQSRIDSARLLVGALASTGHALSLGEISTGHAAVLVEAARRLPGYLAAETVAGSHAEVDGDSGEVRRQREAFTAACTHLQERVLPVARRGTLSMTRQAANRALLAIDAQGQRRRREQARCTREVFVIDELDGISTLIARLGTAQAHAVMTAVDAAAHLARGAAGSEPDLGPRLTIGEYRAQALLVLVVAGARGGDGTGAAALSAHLDIVIPLDVLTGDSPEPAELLGGGTVDADALRDLLADPDVALTMRRLVTDPFTGSLLDYGRRTYRVPDRLRKFIVARDRTCRFPGCRRRAARCQIDHAVSWDDEGRTSPDNLGALCLRHHQLKTHGGWELTDSAPDVSCVWKSPQGRQYLHQAVLRSPRVAVAALGDPDPPPF